MSEQLHLTDDDLVLHYYGEDVPRAESHLAACADCQASFTRLQRVMAFIDSAPAVEAPDGFERVPWARPEPALGRPRRGADGSRGSCCLRRAWRSRRASSCSWPRRSWPDG